eukprot:866224-Pyramimonas_sp.AAC.1
MAPYIHGAGDPLPGNACGQPRTRGESGVGGTQALLVADDQGRQSGDPSDTIRSCALLSHTGVLVRQEGRQEGGGHLQATVHDEPIYPESGGHGRRLSIDDDPRGIAGLHRPGERQ